MGNFIFESVFNFSGVFRLRFMKIDKIIFMEKSFLDKGLFL